MDRPPGVSNDGPTASAHLLRDWPYASDYLLRTLDPDLIESHAISILSRALNVGRLIAFVGAGASMSYGRLSWGGLVRTQLERVKQLYKTYQTTYEASGKGNSGSQHVKDLYKTLEGLTKDRTVKAEHNPMLFQLCEQLEEAIAQDIKINLGKDLPIAGIRAETQKLLIDDDWTSKANFD